MIFADSDSCVACHEGGLRVLRNAADLGKFSALCARPLKVFLCFGIFRRYISVKYSLF